MLAEVGTGFSGKLLKSLSAELNKIAVKTCRFYNLPAIGRGLDPGLTVAEKFPGIRKDKNASEVIREKAS